MKNLTKRLTTAALLTVVITACLMAPTCNREGLPAAADTGDTPAVTTKPPASVPQGKKELIAWLKKAYREAERVYAFFTGYGKIGIGGNRTVIDGVMYEEIAEPELNNRADLKALCEKYFDDNLVAELMGRKVNGALVFVDFNGKLYRFGGYAGLISYDIASDFKFDLIASNDIGASFEVTYTAEIYGQRVTASEVYYADYSGGTPNFDEFKLLIQTMVETLADETEGGRFEIGPREGYTGMTLLDTKAAGGAHWVPLASYGDNASTYTFSFDIDENQTYIVNFWPSDTDGTHYVTLGFLPYKHAGNKFSEFRTFKIESAGGEIKSISKVTTPLKSKIRESGEPYMGELDGVYICKSYSNAAAGQFSRRITLSGDTINAVVSIDGTDAAGTYSGTFTYDRSTGAFNAKLVQTIIYEDDRGMVQQHYTDGKVNGVLLEYGGFLHFLCTYSDFSDLSPSDPVPLTFMPPALPK